MRRTNFFFERQEFKPDAIRKAFYEYKGYYSRSREGDEYRPIALHFGKDEIVFSYHDGEGRINRLFSLYVAPGGLNQQILTEKVQNYWKMPLWRPTPKDKESELREKDNDDKKNVFFIHKSLLSISYFSSLYEFDFINDEFVRCRLFDHRQDRHDFELKNNELRFKYLQERTDRKTIRDKWTINDKGDIKTEYINFRKLLLDFLYELDNTETFEDENFFKLQPALQDNRLLDALSRKCRYLDELYGHRDYRPITADNNLPKKFRTAEDSWLNACFLESYQEVFMQSDGVFESAEDEVKLVIFKTRIGAAQRKRLECFTRQDSILRNKSATFFLKQYSLYNAFRALIHPALIFALMMLMLIIPLGDFVVSRWNKDLVGFFSVVLPLLVLVGLIVQYPVRRINLFKLVLPRMFLGIMLGWSVFWSTEDLWKWAVIAKTPKILVLNLALFIVLILYIFTDIRNKLVRATDWMVLKRTSGLIFLAMLFSFMQGFYVIQFSAKTMLENSGILKYNNRAVITKEDPKIRTDEIKSITIRNIPKQTENLKAIELQGVEIKRDVQDEDSIDILKDKRSKISYDGLKVKLPFLEKFNFKIRYIWPVLLSQFMMSILIGIVLQLLWEDRPITEPL